MSADSANLTQLFRRGREGDSAAFDALMPVVYQELRRIAGSYLRNQSPGHEAYLRLADRSQPDWLKGEFQESLQYSHEKAGSSVAPELRHFGGLRAGETVEVMHGLETRFAEAWLRTESGKQER